MSTQYPASIDDTITLPLAIDNVTPLTASAINDLREAVISIQTALGENPSSTFGNVNQRLNQIETDLASTLAVTSLSVYPSPSTIYGNITLKSGTNISLSRADNTIIINSTSSGGGGGGVTNLEEAVQNQADTPLNQITDLYYIINDGKSFNFQNSNSNSLFSLNSDSDLSLSSLTIGALNNFTSDAISNYFTNGLKVNDNSHRINIGVTNGKIDTAIDLLISANTLSFDDGYKTSSSYTGNLPLANSTSEWNSFQTFFPNGSILNSINSYNSTYVYRKPLTYSGSLVRIDLPITPVAAYLLSTNQTPSPDVISLNNSKTRGAVCANIVGLSIGGSTNIVSNTSNLLLPLNLVNIIDYTSGSPLYCPSNSKQIFGLLQTTGADGATFIANTGSIESPNGNCQISFVTIGSDGTATLISGTDLNILSKRKIYCEYSYRSRLLDTIQTSFKDDSFSSNTSLEGAIAIQGDADVKQYNTTSINIKDTFSWIFTNYNANEMFRINSDSTADINNPNILFGSDAIFQSSASSNNFINGITCNAINTIDVSSQLLLNQIDLGSSSYTGVTYGGVNYLPLASIGTTEWNTFANNFGNTASLIYSINKAYSGTRLSRFQGSITSNTAATVEINSGSFSTSEGTFPSLGSNSTDFQNNINIYLNGLLMRNGVSYDVYFNNATSFKFNQSISAGDVIIIEKFA